MYGWRPDSRCATENKRDRRITERADEGLEGGKKEVEGRRRGRGRRGREKKRKRKTEEDGGRRRKTEKEGSG